MAIAHNMSLDVTFVEAFFITPSWEMWRTFYSLQGLRAKTREDFGPFNWLRVSTIWPVVKRSEKIMVASCSLIPQKRAHHDISSLWCCCLKSLDFANFYLAQHDMHIILWDNTEKFLRKKLRSFHELLLNSQHKLVYIFFGTLNSV